MPLPFRELQTKLDELLTKNPEVLTHSLVCNFYAELAENYTVPPENLTCIEYSFWRRNPDALVYENWRKLNDSCKGLFSGNPAQNKIILDKFERLAKHIKCWVTYESEKLRQEKIETIKEKYLIRDRAFEATAEMHAAQKDLCNFLSEILEVFAPEFSDATRIASFQLSADLKKNISDKIAEIRGNLNGTEDKEETAKAAFTFVKTLLTQPGFLPSYMKPILTSIAWPILRISPANFIDTFPQTQELSCRLLSQFFNRLLILIPQNGQTKQALDALGLDSWDPYNENYLNRKLWDALISSWQGIMPASCEAPLKTVFGSVDAWLEKQQMAILTNLAPPSHPGREIGEALNSAYQLLAKSMTLFNYGAAEAGCVDQLAQMKKALDDGHTIAAEQHYSHFLDIINIADSPLYPIYTQVIQVAGHRKQNTIQAEFDMYARAYSLAPAFLHYRNCEHEKVPELISLARKKVEEPTERVPTAAAAVREDSSAATRTAEPLRRTEQEAEPELQERVVAQIATLEPRQETAQAAITQEHQERVAQTAAPEPRQETAEEEAARGADVENQQREIQEKQAARSMAFDTTKQGKLLAALELYQTKRTTEYDQSGEPGKPETKKQYLGWWTGWRAYSYDEKMATTGKAVSKLKAIKQAYVYEEVFDNSPAKQEIFTPQDLNVFWNRRLGKDYLKDYKKEMDELTASAAPGKRR